MANLIKNLPSSAVVPRGNRGIINSKGISFPLHTEWYNLLPNVPGLIIKTSDYALILREPNGDSGALFEESTETFQQFYVLPLNSIANTELIGLPSDEPLELTTSLSNDIGGEWATSNIAEAYDPSLSDKPWLKIGISFDGTKMTAITPNEIYSSSDAGKNWFPKATITDGTWKDVVISDNGVVQTALPSVGRPYCSYDSGETWKAVDIEITDGNGIAMSADGTRQTIIANNQIHVSVDSGNTWTTNTIQGNCSKLIMSFDGAYQTVAFTPSSTYLSDLYVSTDYGSTWAVKDLNLNILSMAMSPDGLVQLAGLAQTTLDGARAIFISNNGGNTWKERSLTLGSYVGLAISSDKKKITTISNNLNRLNVCIEDNLQPTFSDIIIGPYHGLAVTDTGRVVGWGGTAGSSDAAKSLRNLSGVGTVATSMYHSLALTNTGTVTAWGGNTYGQTNVPPSLSGVTAIAAGLDFSLALTTTGKVTAWGSNGKKQLNIPSRLTGVIDIKAAEYTAFALTNTGAVTSWGAPELFSNNTITRYMSSGIVAIDAQGQSLLAITNQGKVIQTGAVTSYAAVPAGLSNVVAIAAGYAHGLALTNAGTLTAWGQNSHGQLNIPPSLTKVSAIAAGYSSCYALTDDGIIVGWGLSSGEAPTPVDSLYTIWTTKEIDKKWNQIVMSSDGTKQVATVYGGQIYTSVDSGNKWTAAESNRNWCDISITPDGTKIIAAANPGRIYASTLKGI